MMGGPVPRSPSSVAVLRRVDSTAAGGLGNPGRTVQSRNCPTLLLARCSGRSSWFVFAGAARGAGVLLGKRSGTGPVAVRGGSRNALCLQGVSAAFRLRRSLGCGCRVVTPNRIMLAVERAGLAQAGAAAQFGSRRDTGPPLFLGQGLAIHERPRDTCWRRRQRRQPLAGRTSLQPKPVRYDFSFTITCPGGRESVVIHQSTSLRLLRRPSSPQRQPEHTQAL